MLFLAQHLTMGGAEELLRGIATGLPSGRFEVVVGCLTREGAVAEDLRAAGVRVEYLPGEPGPRDPLAFARLVRFVRAEAPQVVHTFLLNAGLYGRLAAWLAGVPAIYHAEQNVYFRRSRRHLWFEQFLAGRTTMVVTCCQAVGSFYQSQVGIASQRLEVIYNAVDFAVVEPSETRMAARTALGYEESDLVLGGLGRLTEQKAHDLLLDALAEISERYPSVRLFLAGQGPLQAALEERIRSRGLDGRVRLLGLRRDRARLYAAMDIFVLPSRWEGLSLALVEAAGLGLPIVATDVGGNSEVVSGEAGIWLVRPGEVPALAKALEAAVELVQAARQSGGQTRYERSRLRERFSLAAHLTQLESSYRRALGWPASETVGQDLPPSSLVEGRGAS